MTSETEKTVAGPKQQTQPKRLLILGFSCIAVAVGPGAMLKETLEGNGGFEVFLCGLGGLTPLIIPSAFESMRRRHGDFTHVILEISTSIYAQQTLDTEAEARDLCRDILHAIQATGTRAAVVHLHRLYTAPLKLNWNGMLDEAAAAAGAPVVDLADGLVRSHGRAFADGLLKDSVHPTPDGTEFQTRTILAELASWLEDTGHAAMPPPPAYQRRLVPFTHFAAEAGELTQQDYGFPFIRISEGERFVADFGRTMQLLAFTFGFGLWGGILEVSIDGRPPFTVAAIDEFSKYERLGMRMFSDGAGRPVRKIEFVQSAVIPDVTPRRGEITKGPREGRLMGVIAMEPFKTDQTA